METIQIPDEHLKRLAEEEGPRSAAAVILRSLAKKRAKDRQVRGSLANTISSAQLLMPRWKPGSESSLRTTCSSAAD